MVDSMCHLKDCSNTELFPHLYRKIISKQKEYYSPKKCYECKYFPIGIIGGESFSCLPYLASDVPTTFIVPQGPSQSARFFEQVTMFVPCYCSTTKKITNLWPHLVEHLSDGPLSMWIRWVGWWTIWWYITAAWWCRGQTLHQSSAPGHATWFVLRQWARFVLIVAAMTSAVAPFLQWVLRVYHITCSICIPKIIGKATETTGFSFTNKIHNLVK
jgi:hypothetical protein